MTLPRRGHTIGWLGGILALGIFLPVLTLADFSPAPPGPRRARARRRARAAVPGHLAWPGL
jgi:hypothetical protein